MRPPDRRIPTVEGKSTITLEEAMIPLHRKIRIEPMRLLVGPADAGHRRDSPGLDEWRGLTDIGRWQAEQLVDQVSCLPILRILTSPSLRCRQTVMPLARSLSLDVEPCYPLRAGADPAALAQFIQQPETRNAVLCTHRDVLLGLFTRYAAQGHRLIEGIARLEMASPWAVYGGEDDSPPQVRWLRTDMLVRRADGPAPGMASIA
jgi:phosphohistidine phosphatase SixA